MKIENTKFKFNPNQTIYDSIGFKDPNEIANSFGSREWYCTDTYGGGYKIAKMNAVFVEIINRALMKINKDCDFIFKYYMMFNHPIPSIILNINDEEYDILERDGEVTRFGEDQDNPGISINTKDRNKIYRVNSRRFGDYEWHNNEDEIEYLSNKIKDYVLSESK